MTLSLTLSLSLTLTRNLNLAVALALALTLTLTLALTLTLTLTRSTGATMIALVCPPAAYLLLGRGAKDAAPRNLLLDVVAAMMLVMGLAIVPSKLFCA